MKIGHCCPRELEINCVVLIMKVVRGPNGPVREERTENNSPTRTLMNELSGTNITNRRDPVRSERVLGGRD